eukprot:12144350-Alexandrium_andersonii.AAC.1
MIRLPAAAVQRPASQRSLRLTRCREAPLASVEVPECHEEALEAHWQSALPHTEAQWRDLCLSDIEHAWRLWSDALEAA